MSDDPYKTLQVDREADVDVIQAAYRRLAQKFHPDVAANPEAAARMTSINWAWELLRDPDRRAAFDQAQVVQPPPIAPPAPPGRPDPGVSRGAANQPDVVSRDWTMGRSTVGGGYDPSTMRSAEGHAGAGPPPGNPSGTVLNFGRYAGWSLGEVARRDIEYLEWLDRAPIGRQYKEEVDKLLRQAGRRRSADTSETDRRGLFRRR